MKNYLEVIGAPLIGIYIVFIIIAGSVFLPSLVTDDVEFHLTLTMIMILSVVFSGVYFFERFLNDSRK